MDIETLKKQRKITRDDISALLASLGKPGDNREAKLEAMRSLNRHNKQGHGIEMTAESYQAF
jgi:hypothetical protein